MKTVKQPSKQNLSFGTLAKTFDDLLMNLPPRCMYIEMYYVLNAFKFGTLFMMLFLIYYYQNFSTGAFLYAALHGAYGFAWISKHFLFPDNTWNLRVPLGTNLVAGLVLVGYWGFGFSIMSRNAIQEPSPERICLAVFLVSFGCAMVIAADAHKNFTLMFKKGLISDGWAARTRNPNYLAEMMIYSGFAALTGRWESWAYLAFVWLSLFVERMIMKDLSLRKKEGWEEYSKVSSFLLPKAFRSDTLNYLFYALVLGVGCFLYFK